MRNPNCERIFTFNHVADCDIAQEKPKSKDQSDGGQQKKKQEVAQQPRKTAIQTVGNGQQLCVSLHIVFQFLCELIFSPVQII